MTPVKIKSDIQSAYLQAISNRNSQFFRTGNISQLFRGVTLYGREAGKDFVETNIRHIVEEAMETARCKGPCLELPLHGIGLSAGEGMGEALRRLTDLQVELARTSLKLIWADDKPSLL